MFVITYKTYFLWIGAIIVISSAAIIFTFGLKPSIDFTGGSLLEMRYGVLPAKEAVEEVVEAQNIGSFLVRQSESDLGTGYLISTKDLSTAEQKNLETALLALGGEGQTVRYTAIGPVIGEELKDKAIYAIGGVLLIIIIYVAFAFSGIGKPVSSWVYGLMTITVLGHDILVPIAMMSLLGYLTGAEVDILFVTALLTILGYSVNDTIVIFDRVREKLVQNRTEKRTKIIEPGGIEREEVEYTLNEPFGNLVGLAVKETMVRSVNTSLTVLLALSALFIFGSDVTQTFVLVLIAGVIAGAYSSIFIASPLLVLYAERLEKKLKVEVKK